MECLLYFSTFFWLWKSSNTDLYLYKFLHLISNRFQIPLVVHFLEYEIQLLQETLAKLAQTKTHTMKKRVLPGRIETLSWRIATASLYLHQKSAYSFVSNYSGESLFWIGRWVNCSILSHDELKMLIRQIKVMNNRIEEVEGWLIGSWNLYSPIRMGNGIR